MSESEVPERTLGRYTILRKLGQGGMGEVHLARDPQLGREVALKVLSSQVVRDDERRSRFLREARAAAALKHANITTIYEIGESDGLHFLAFEYVEGPTLKEAVAGRTLSMSKLLDLAVPLADALAYAHGRGVIHRDVKLDNVMLTERGQPKLLDFGLAKVQHEGSWTGDSRDSTTISSGALMGTPAAMSPEQVMGKRVDARTDVFSFGILLYELAGRERPFRRGSLLETINAVVNEEPRSLSELRPDLPDDFVAIVERALRKEPGERYQDMGELAAELRRLDRRATSILLKGKRKRRRKRRPVGVILAVAILFALVWALWPRIAPFLTGAGSPAD